MDKNKLFLGFVTAALGLFLLISPETFLSFFVILLGIASILDGIFILATTRNLIVDQQYKMIVTIRGILSIVIGALAVMLPLVFVATIWKAMAYTLAIYLIISAGMQFYTIAKLHRNGIMIRQSMIEVFSSLVIALVLLVIPSESVGPFFIRIFGFILMLSGVGLAIMQWKSRPTVILPDSVEDAEEAQIVTNEENSVQENPDKSE